jgi:MYXO-CTERM domain-containing protein
MRGSVFDLRVSCLVGVWRCLWLAALGLVAVGAASPERARAWCRTTTETPLTGSDCIHEGLPLAWDRQCISFTVEDPGESGPPIEDVRDAADRSFATWSSVQCDGRPIGLELRQTRQLAECGVAQHDRQGPNMNAILFVEDWNSQDDLPADAFAVTLVWNLVKTGEIVDADMLVNPTLGVLTICGDSCPRNPVVVDVQNVITHEAGHFLGLAHSNVFDATMSSTAPVGETKKRSLDADDAEGLCAIYGSLPPAQCDEDGGDYVPPRGFSARCSTPRQTGCTCSMPGTTRPSGWALGLGALALAAWFTRRRAS